MTPLIRFSRACRLARLQPRNPVATRATPPSPATLAYPRLRKLPWVFRCPSLALRSSLQERGTIIGAKDTVVFIETKKLDRLGLYGRYSHVLHSDSPKLLYDL